MRKSAIFLMALSCCASLFLASALDARASKTKTGTANSQADYKLFEKKLPKDEQVLHALNRLTFGPRPGDIKAVKKMGLTKWIDLQLHPNRIRESKDLEARLKPIETRSMAERKPGAIRDLLTPAQIRTLRTGTPDQRRELVASLPPEKVAQILAAVPGARPLLNAISPELRRKIQTAAQGNPRQVATDLMEAKLYRAIYSERQLEEVLVDFWYNHFNVDLNKGADRFLVANYERDAIRPHVLGKFRDLLEATATSPAMLFYLDNWQSTAPDTRPAPRAQGAARGLNENYARELMELHTLGVDGGYTQKDIIEVARCFTGWTILNPRQNGSFVFRPAMHDQGEKIVLGVKIPAGGGKEDGEKVLDILARNPSTARFISKELAQRFVADDPPPALIDRMAKTFHDTDGDLRAVLATMFKSKEFFSQGAYRAKVKTPFDLVVSAARATGAQVDSATPLANQIANLGEPLYRKLEPTGYSNLNADWVDSSSLLSRMNFAMQLAQDRVPRVHVDVNQFATAPAIVAKQVLFTSATPPTLQALEKAADEHREKNPGQPPAGGLLAGLVIGSPDFQRR